MHDAALAELTSATPRSGSRRPRRDEWEQRIPADSEISGLPSLVVVLRSLLTTEWCESKSWFNFLQLAALVRSVRVRTQSSDTRFGHKVRTQGSDTLHFRWPVCQEF